MEALAPPGRTHTPVVVPWYATAALVVLAAAAAAVVLGPEELAHTVGPIGIVIGDTVAGIMFIRRARFLQGVERRAWTLVGIGLIVAATGIVLLAADVVLTGDAPTFGFTDLFFGAGYAMVLVGFASLPHTAGHPLQRARIAIDGLIGAISAGALLWVFVLEEIVHGLDDAPVGDRIFGSIYPLIDLAVVVIIMIVTVRRSSLRFDVRMLLFTGAVLLQSIADMSYLVEGVGKSFTEAEPLFAVYLAAAALFVATAIVVDRVPAPREYADRQVPFWSILAPYTAAAVMVSVLVARIWDGTLDQGDRVLFLSSLIVAVLVIGRQGIAIRENRMIVERQRTELVSSISHELRTPLTAMVGFLAVLQEDPKLHLEERIEMIDVVVEQADYLERIIEDLLFMAQGSPTQMMLHRSNQCVANLAEHACNVAVNDRAGIAIEIDPELTADMDPDRMQQVLVNLISNARRYGGDRCLVVAEAPDDRLVIEVHDSGPGVPKKYELMVWDRFERGPNRYNAVVPGSGIGLAMVRSIVEAHGGSATYRRSERLGGSCFVIDLPRSVGPEPVTPVVSSGAIAVG